MDANTINEIEASNPTAETIELINHWREIVKPAIYRLTGGKWKRYHEPNFLRNGRKVIEENRRKTTTDYKKPSNSRPQTKDRFQTNGRLRTPTRHSEQWTVDPFWDVDRPTWPNQTYKTDPDHRTKTTFNWARYVGVKVVQYVKMDTLQK